MVLGEVSVKARSTSLALYLSQSALSTLHLGMKVVGMSGAVVRSVTWMAEWSLCRVGWRDQSAVPAREVCRIARSRAEPFSWVGWE